jgi:hypothetical protein
MELIERLRANPNADIQVFRNYYVNHFFEKAQYINNISSAISHRPVKHVALLHFI